MFRSRKTLSAGTMRFWKTKSKSTQRADVPKDSASLQATAGPRSNFMPGYLRLEQRALLSATFMTFGTTELVLNDFDAGQNLDFAQQDAVVNGVAQDSFVFTVESGSLSGSTANPFFELESVNGGINNQLEVATAFFQGASANAQLTIDGLSSTGAVVEFTQSSPDLLFDTLNVSNFANDNRDLSLMTTGDVTLNNVTVFDSDPTDGVTVPAMLDVSVNGDLRLAGLTGNLSADPDANVDLFASGNILMVNGSELTSEQNTNVTSASGSITLADVSTGNDLQVQAANNITQQTNSDIAVGSSATVSSTNGNILLATSPEQSLTIQGQANFMADQIEIGLDGETAGGPVTDNVQLGSVNLNASRGVLVEDDATLFTGSSSVNDLFVSSGQQIGNTADASITATNAQLNSATDIILGNQTGDSILLSEIGVVAANAHLEIDGDLSINGVLPSPTNSQPIALGTSVEQTLFVIADGSVEQTQGDLSALQIGIEASDYVHLTSVAATNEAIAISAGGSTLLTDPSLSSTLEALAAVENGEVDVTRPQAIAIAHRGDAVITNVTSVTGVNSLTGFDSTDGSVSVFADQSILLQQDVTAFGTTADPQVTLFSAAGDANNPAIFFDGGQALVSGPTNFGIVNANQTFANFLDTDGFLFEGTTQILTLNTDGTVSQDIVIEYGNPGEAGYRVGIVFDSQNEVGNPVEDINLFTPSITVASEAFEDTLFQENTVIRLLIGGNEGGIETFSKVEDFTAAAVIDHFDDPNVFSDITVRNDQDINLFSGSLDTVDNSLNENRQQLLAVFDLPRGGALPAPAINLVNAIEVKRTFDLPFESPPPLDQTNSIFDRAVAPFESGDLRFVQVQIPIDDLELVGDEVVLKQPALVYPAIEDAAEQEFENVGENETVRIVEQIERSPAAEPGYWYRIFKAYENRDDELIFYYYKTGEVDGVSAEPAEGESTDVLPADENPKNDNENQILESEPLGPKPEAGVNDLSSDGFAPSETRHPQSFATSALLVGLLRNENSRDLPAEDSSPNGHAAIDEPAVGDENIAQTDHVEAYDRLSRLKRKLKRCL